MTPTQTYTRIHNAFADVAEYEGLTPYSVRLMVALNELGHGHPDRIVSSDELERVLDGDRNAGSAVRRALLMLYESGHVTGTGPDGGPRKRGCRTRLKLTERGIVAVRSFQKEAA